MENYFYRIDTDTDNDTIINTDSENSIIIYDSDSITQEEDYLDSEYDDYSINTDDEIEYNNIYQEESPYIFEEKVNNHYYIGTSIELPGDNFHIMANTISINCFLNYPYYKLLHYLWLYSIISIKKPRIEILKLCIRDDGVYSVINKTFWIRIIQRRWKRKFKEFQELLIKKKTIQNLKIREITGNFSV